jgi:hypothetical protein
MNMEPSTVLTFFLNNRAIVMNDGCSIVLHNNKQVQTGKDGQKRNVHFYYVLEGINQPVPLVATNQVFYHAIWDAPQRSNRSLKQTALQAKKASSLPTKKAKASSARPILYLYPQGLFCQRVLVPVKAHKPRKPQLQGLIHQEMVQAISQYHHHHQSP